MDGASRALGSKIGLCLQSPIREQIEQVIRLRFSASNNEAEYEAILVGLNLALTLSTAKLKIYSNPQLVIGQIQGEYKAKDKHMAHYLSKVQVDLDKLSE